MRGIVVHGLVAVAVVAVVLGAATPAHAGLSQPNGIAIPSAPGCAGGQPTGLGAVFACQCPTTVVGGSGCNIGAVCSSPSSCDNGQHGTCETTLWHSFNDNTCIPSNLSGLDPVADASTTPETFHPTCGLTFTVVTRGTAIFKNIFGWYNVTSAKPQASDLHVMLDCTASAGAQVVLDVRSRPEYKGGDIGFFLITPESHTSKATCAGGDCCATVNRATTMSQGYIYYSQKQYNDDNNGSNSFIHLLTYDSKITSRKFYFAWEDIYGGSDDEFCDLVTSVQGLDCSGGGTKCDTGQKGVCAQGLSVCENGSLSCQVLYQPSSEKCNGLDDDCNGLTDDGATCPSGQVCQNGQCVPHCTRSSEFGCPVDLSCDATSGLCADPTCVGVTCTGDQVCRGGACVSACDSLVCPHGTFCHLGACLDPCAHLQCPDGKTCELGLCVPSCNQCGGVVCAAPLQCDATTGACTDPSCPSGCPAGTYCDQGACKDSCAGAVCPEGQVCSTGECVPAALAPDGGQMQTGSDGGGNNNAASSGGCSGCAHSAPHGNKNGNTALLLLLVGGGLFVRRRR
jgi:MYXO-CTERM domain-containing protein